MRDEKSIKMKGKCLFIRVIICIAPLFVGVDGDDDDDHEEIELNECVKICNLLTWYVHTL